MTCGYTGTALQHHTVRGDARHDRAELVAQGVRGLEARIGGEVVLEEAVQRAWNMAADAVERFVLAAIAVRSACIQQHALVRGQVAFDGLRIHGDRERRAGLEVAGRVRGHLLRQRLICRFPCLQPAIEERHRVVAEPAQQPPQTRRIHAAVRVIRDHLLTLLQAERRKRIDESLPLGQRMSPVGAGFRSRQVAIEMQVARLRQMSRAIGFFAGIGIDEIEPAIRDEHAARRSGNTFGEIGGGDQRGVVGVGHDNS